MPRPRVIAAVVALLAILAFAPALTGTWIYDDWSLIAQNPYAHTLAEWPRWFTRDFWDIDPEASLALRLVYWRPAINASYALDWQLGGGSPVMFHITNTLLHAATAVMAFFALRRWTAALVPAAIAAGLFAVHPAHAENVAWITGRTDVMCALFVLVALAGMHRRDAGKRGGLALEIAGTIGAYLSKEQAIVLPVLVVVEHWAGAGRPALDLAFAKRAARAVAPQLAVAVLYLGARAVWLPIKGFASIHHGLVDHGAALVDALGRFVASALLPIELVARHGLSASDRPSAVYIGLGAVVIALSLVAAWRLRRTHPVVVLALAAFFVTLGPTLEMASQGLAPLLAERFLYLPSLPLALLAAHALSLAPPRLAHGVGLLAVAAALVLAVQRARIYRSEPVFADRLVALHPANYEARRLRVDTGLRARRSERVVADLVALRPYVTRALLVENAYEIADVATQLVPDLDAAGLRALDEFVGHLIDRDVPRAPLALPLLGVNLDAEIPPAPPRASVVPRMYALRANLASRRGEYERALATIRRALDACATCAPFITMHALVLARSGRIDDAIAALARSEQGVGAARVATTRAHLVIAGEHFQRASTLAGPDRLREQHAGLVKLGEWGKAYQLLAPYQAVFARSPALSVTFAETALRAGRPDDARAVLAAHRSPAEIDELVAAWRADMGWEP